MTPKRHKREMRHNTLIKNIHKVLNNYKIVCMSYSYASMLSSFRYLKCMKIELVN